MKSNHITMTVWEEWEGMDQMQFTQLTQINERSSADSLFRKGDAKLYPFHFGQHLVLVYTECRSVNVSCGQFREA